MPSISQNGLSHSQWGEGGSMFKVEEVYRGAEGPTNLVAAVLFDQLYRNNGFELVNDEIFKNRISKLTRMSLCSGSPSPSCR